jgi:uncharacterized protein YceH (UPF0502 family)
MASNNDDREQLETNDDGAESAAPQWKPLTRLQRRVAGVLIEKSKTTPDAYPMSLNGVKVASNQKSNRAPKMDLEEHQVEDVLYELRHLGAAVEIHSGGRVPKFKHQMYEWLCVDKAELAVMAELLLRGEQTIGELRARAARMEKTITGIGELRPVLELLKQKNLIVELTPTGRGQTITHNLYQPDEIERLKKEFGTVDAGPTEKTLQAHPQSTGTAASVQAAIAPVKDAELSSSYKTETPTDEQQAASSALQERVEVLEEQVGELEKVVAKLREQLDELLY